MAVFKILFLITQKSENRSYKNYRCLSCQHRRYSFCKVTYFDKYTKKHFPQIAMGKGKQLKLKRDHIGF